MILAKFYEKFSPKYKILVRKAQRTVVFFFFLLIACSKFCLKVFTKLHDSSCKNTKFSTFWGGTPPSDTSLCMQAHNWHWCATNSYPPLSKTDLHPCDVRYAMKQVGNHSGFIPYFRVNKVDFHCLVRTTGQIFTQTFIITCLDFKTSLYCSGCWDIQFLNVVLCLQDIISYPHAILLVIPCLFMQYWKILYMDRCCITWGRRPNVIRHPSIGIFRIA